MTVKLFGIAGDVDNNKIQSLAADVNKLGINNISIKDVNGVNVVTVWLIITNICICIYV